MPKSRLRKNRRQLNQVEYSEPRKTFVATYLTKKGLRELKRVKSKYNGAELKAAVQEIRNKYEKNGYKKNPDAVPIKVIRHRV